MSQSFFGGKGDYRGVDLESRASTHDLNISILKVKHFMASKLPFTIALPDPLV
jgi:hypothetical protein